MLLSQGTQLCPQPRKNGGGKEGYGKAVAGDGRTVVTMTTLRRLLDFHVETRVAKLREWPGLMGPCRGHSCTCAEPAVILLTSLSYLSAACLQFSEYFLLIKVLLKKEFFLKMEPLVGSGKPTALCLMKGRR